MFDIHIGASRVEEHTACVCDEGFVAEDGLDSTCCVTDGLFLGLLLATLLHR